MSVQGIPTWTPDERNIRHHLKQLHKSAMHIKTFSPDHPRHCRCSDPSHEHYNPNYSTRGSEQGVLECFTKPKPGKQRARPQTTRSKKTNKKKRQKQKRPSTTQQQQQPHPQPQTVTYPFDGSKWEQQSFNINQKVIQQRQQLLNRKYLISPKLSPNFIPTAYPIHHEPFPSFSPDRRDQKAMTADLLLLTRHKSTSKLLFNKASGGFVPSAYDFDNSMGMARTQSYSPLHSSQMLQRSISSSPLLTTTPASPLSPRSSGLGENKAFATTTTTTPSITPTLLSYSEWCVPPSYQVPPKLREQSTPIKQHRPVYTETIQRQHSRQTSRRPITGK